MKRKTTKSGEDLQSRVEEKEPFSFDPAEREVVEWPEKYFKAKGETSRGKFRRRSSRREK